MQVLLSLFRRVGVVVLVLKKFTVVASRASGVDSGVIHGSYLVGRLSTCKKMLVE